MLSRFRIILLELHDLHLINDEHAFQNVIKPLLDTLDRQFVCVHAHPNNAGGHVRFHRTQLNVPFVIELTFLRRDRMVCHPEANTSKPLLPHPEDIELNIESTAPLFLNEAWCWDQRRPNAARQRKSAIESKYAGLCIDELQKELWDMDDRVQTLQRRLDELHWMSVLIRMIKRPMQWLRR